MEALLLIVGVPFLFFMAGVAASDVLRLHPVPRHQLYVMGMVTAMLVVPLMASSQYFEVPQEHYRSLGVETAARYEGHAFMEDVLSYLIYAGGLTFLGLSAPSLFRQLRAHHERLPPGAGPAPRD